METVLLASAVSQAQAPGMGGGRRIQEAQLWVSSAFCCGRIGEMLMGTAGDSSQDLGTGPQVSPGPAELEQPVWVGPPDSSSGVLTLEEELEPCVVSPVDQLLPLGMFKLLCWSALPPTSTPHQPLGWGNPEAPSPPCP